MALQSKDMDPNNIELLKESIAHWERMRDNPGGNEYPSAIHCPLCRRYRAKECENCPIKEFIGQSYCAETPYYDAEDAHNYFSVRSLEWEEAAQKEIDFLQRVLNWQEELEKEYDESKKRQQNSSRSK